LTAKDSAIKLHKLMEPIQYWWEQCCIRNRREKKTGLRQIDSLMFLAEKPPMFSGSNQ